MSKRVYMTDAARRILATRDGEMNADPKEALEDILQRMDNLESALGVLIMRGADGDAGTTCCEHPVDNDDETDRRNIEVLNSEVTPGMMGTVSSGAFSGDDFPSPASINAKNSEFWSTPKATPTVTVMGNPGPAPGNENSGRGQNFMPGAAHSINNARRLSTTAPTLNMGKTGSWSTDRRVYSQIVRPSRGTMDAAKANIRTRETAAAHSSATIAEISRKHREFKWGA